VVRGDASQLPLIHLDDAVIVRALDGARTAAVYDIVDDRAVSMTEIVETIGEYTGSRPPLKMPAWLPRVIAPYMSRVTSIRLALPNERAKADLGWQPKYPTVRDGLRPAQLMGDAARDS
jgi:nucleoside-diphosphate-sugar epimerase